MISFGSKHILEGKKSNLKHLTNKELKQETHEKKDRSRRITKYQHKKNLNQDHIVDDHSNKQTRN